MVSEIIKNMPMNIDFDSGWLPVNSIGSFYPGYEGELQSLQISWSEVSGTHDAQIRIYVSNDCDARSLIEQIDIDSISNVDDCVAIAMPDNFEFLRIDYISNSLTGGKLSICASYKLIKK